MGVFRDAAHLAEYRELADLHVCHAYLGFEEQATQGPALFVTVAPTRGRGGSEDPEAKPMWAAGTVPSVGEESCACSHSDTEPITS